MSAGWAPDSRPPAGVIWPAALQHIGLGSVTLVFPLMVASAAEADAALLATYMSLSMLALGFSTLLQALAWRGIGSGFLIPTVFTAVYLPPALAAAATGGLGAVAGLTLVAGLTEVALASTMHRLRPWLPTELVGLVVLMIGLILGLLGLRLMLGIAPGALPPQQDTPAALLALAAIIACAVWGGARLRSLAVLIGLGVGIALHVAMTLAAGRPLLPAPVELHLPSWPIALPSLELPLLPGFILGALACLVRASGDIVASQRANDPGWKRPNLASLRAGTMADGLGTVAAGLLGVPGVNTYTASVGLSIATGVRARRVAFAVGALWIVLALTPGAASLMLAAPRGVLGAALFFAAAFIVVTGMGIVTQRLLDGRRIIAVGTALLIGLSYDELPWLYAELPEEARLLISSSLVLGLLVGLGLNALFRAGVTQTKVTAWQPAEGVAALQGKVHEAGAAWGARAEVVAAAERALEEVALALSALLPQDAPVRVALRFDEFNFDLALRWHGPALLEAGSQAMAIEDADQDEAVAVRLAVLLLRHAAHRVTEVALPDSQRELRLHFEH